MKLVVIGIGYVGLVTAVCFAEMGYEVICLDIDKEKVQSLENGICPIFEPGLEEMLKRNLKAKRLSFTTDYHTAISQTTLCFIAVNTPSIPDSGAADTTFIQKAAISIAEHLKNDCIIVIKSTVPVGTASLVTHLISESLKQRKVDIDFDVVSNPEFLKEGNAIQDCLKPDRIIIGVSRPHLIPVMKELYAPFMLNHERLIVMDPQSAELCKYAANAMLATRISFMNELAGLCEKLNADINMIRKGIGSDHRIGGQFLYAGPGYGGSCLPKDIRALMAQAQALDYPLSIMHAVDEVNCRQQQVIFKKIKDYFVDDEGLKGKVIGILGLSFKPDTDDIRAAPSIILIQALLKEGAILRLFDPVAMTNMQQLFGNEPSIQWCSNEVDTSLGADAMVLMTEWKQFRFLNFETILASMNGNAFFDGRNQYHPEEMAQKGFDYFSIGHVPIYASETSDSESLGLEMML